MCILTAVQSPSLGTDEHSMLSDSFTSDETPTSTGGFCFDSNERDRLHCGIASRDKSTSSNGDQPPLHPALAYQRSGSLKTKICMSRIHLMNSLDLRDRVG